MLLLSLLQVKEVAEGEAQRYHDHAITLREMLKFLRSCKVTGADGVDLLRCERLNSLEPVTRERVYFKNNSGEPGLRFVSFRLIFVFLYFVLRYFVFVAVTVPKLWTVDLYGTD